MIWHIALAGCRLPPPRRLAASDLLVIEKIANFRSNTVDPSDLPIGHGKVMETG